MGFKPPMTVTQLRAAIRQLFNDAFNDDFLKANSAYELMVDDLEADYKTMREEGESAAAAQKQCTEQFFENLEDMIDAAQAEFISLLDEWIDEKK